MNEFLVRHAMKHVWCSPDQDRQFLFRPMRLTPDYGVKRSVSIEWDTYRLPDDRNTYQVYQLGQNAPQLLSLLSDKWSWHSFDKTMNSENVILEAYGEQGKILPRFECYFRKTPTRNLVVAIKTNPVIMDLIKEPLYIRFYTNAFFNSQRSDGLKEKVFTDGRVAGKRSSVVSFKRDLEEIKSLNPEGVYQYHNGCLVDTLRPDDIETGDKIEYVLDESIKTVDEMKLKDLATFTSTLDEKRKYLLRRPKGSTNTIDFHDDIDFWLVKKEGGREQGFRLHKGHASTVRMVTHQDMSLSVEPVLKQIRQREGWDNPDEVLLRLCVRHSGYDRSLIQDHHRIKDLYQLDDAGITRAMVGADANVPEWQAANLELSGYTEIMRSSVDQITPRQVQDAYGYHGVVNQIAKTPQIPHTLPSGKKGVIPPWRLKWDATFYEYDRKGRLTAWYYKPEAKNYLTQHETTGYVEALVGRGGLRTSTEYNRSETEVDTDKRYMTYVCGIKGGLPDYKWREGIEGDDYELKDGKVSWLLDQSLYFTAVRGEYSFLSETFEAKPFQGMIQFDIESEDLEGDKRERGPVHLPYGKLDLFLNGHSLIEGLDYFVQWPKVVICNKEYLKNDRENQKVTVRAYGFLTQKGERHPRREFGFSNNGLLSRNRRYDVREGINLRYVADGRIWTRDELSFVEREWGVHHESLRNGAPYLVDEILTPLKESDVVERSVSDYRQSSLDVDERISDYLTRYLERPTIPEVNLIPQRYRVLSPFTSRIHYDLVSGFLYPEGIEEQYSDEDIREWLEYYEWLLDFDPVIQGYDEDYVNIHPHELDTETSLTIYQYNFLKRAIDVYLKGCVNLSTHVSIKEGWV